MTPAEIVADLLAVGAADPGDIELAVGIMKAKMRGDRTWMLEQELRRAILAAETILPPMPPPEGPPLKDSVL